VRTFLLSVYLQLVKCFWVLECFRYPKGVVVVGCRDGTGCRVAISFAGKVESYVPVDTTPRKCDNFEDGIGLTRLGMR
jgi:hypothetical protein